LSHPKSFIEVERLGGKTEVRFRVELAFDLATGAAEAGRYGAIHHEGRTTSPVCGSTAGFRTAKTAAEELRRK
jgi:hypothetical protein